MALEIKQLRLEHRRALADLFLSIAGDGEAFFHPHPMTIESAHKICGYIGGDLYYGVVDGEDILAYGMLRGWDEGYDVPSLGIAVRANMRGSKLGEMLMHFLHSAARQKGAKFVRLKAHPENAAAVNLYRKIGYEFDSELEPGQLVGKIRL
jgi:ribosomal-protein-alanine N-acetyltransferase